MPFSSGFTCNAYLLTHLKCYFTENAKGKDNEASGKLIKKEHQEVGAVQFRIYLYHLRACGIPLVILGVYYVPIVRL